MLRMMFLKFFSFFYLNQVSLFIQFILFPMQIFINNLKKLSMSKNENIKKVSKSNKENYVIMYQHVKIYRTYKIHVSNSRYSRACYNIKSKPTYFEKNMAFIAPFFRWRRNDLKRCQIYTRAMRSPIKPHNVLPERSFLP